MAGHKIHFLTLESGDLFRFTEGGPVFRRVDGASGVPRVQPEGGGARCRLSAVQEFEGCFVYPVDDEDEPEEDD